jgi:hypothetical protein
MKTLAIFLAMFAAAIASLGQTNTSAPLYVHIGIESSDSTKRLLSCRIHLGQAIYAGGDDYWKLTGHIERRGTNLVSDLMGDIGAQSQYYRGELKFEQPIFAQGGAASGGVVPMWFALSTNSDFKPLLQILEERNGNGQGDDDDICA